MADIAGQMAGLKLDGAENTPDPTAPATIVNKDGAESTPDPTASATIVDKDGDLYLVVGREKKAFQVDSRALIRASEVWERMLTGGWAESRPATGAWVVALPEDDPRAMETLLHLVHLNNRQVPRALSNDDLFGVAAAVDLYGAARCLGPWAAVWCRPAAAWLRTRQSGYDDHLLKLAWTGWVFGSREIFEAAVRGLILEAEVDGEGRLCDPSGTYLDEFKYFKAMDLDGFFRQYRLHIITSLLSVIEDVVYKGVSRANRSSSSSSSTTATTTTTTTTAVSYCRCNQISWIGVEALRAKAREDCGAVIAASLIGELIDEDLFPVPSAEDVFESATALKARLTAAVRRIRTLGIPAPAGAHVDRAFHQGCHPGDRIAKRLMNVVTLSRGTTAAHEEHLERQKSAIEGQGE